MLCDAHVNRVNLDGNTAVGANFTYGGKKYDISSRKEVVVCGGTVKSPQILELSGIGNPEVLKRAGVKVVVENQGVGRNMQDHSLTTLMADVKPGVFTLDRFNSEPQLAQEAMVEYMTSHTGVFGLVFSANGFLPFKSIVSAEEFADTMTSIKKITPSSDFHKRQLDEVIKQLESETSANVQVCMFPLTFDIRAIAPHQSQNPKRADGAGVTFVLCTEYPVSRGTCHITSSGKAFHPLLHYVLKQVH